MGRPLVVDASCQPKRSFSLPSTSSVWLRLTWIGRQSVACSFLMLSRALWYRDQAALALQRGHETRDPILRAGFDDLGHEWLKTTGRLNQFACRFD
jgi:hypothetical protein